MVISKLILTLSFLIVCLNAFSQCPMCSMSASTNLADGGTEALGLNIGILFMLSMPYILVLALGYFLYKKFRGKTEAV